LRGAAGKFAVWINVLALIISQAFLNPIDEATANRDGIIQVVRKMKWYSSLSKLLLEKTFEHDGRFTELRGRLANHILDLYKALLKYIIKTVCAHNRHQALEFLRNLVKLNDWNGSLDDVNKVEDSVKAAASDYGVRQANSYLGLLANIHISKAQDEIMQKLCVTDITAEIESLQKRKDHLLADSYKWILDNQEYKDFTDWQYGNTKRLLWIKGDAGKGKTMLLIGIVTELTAELETQFDKSHLSYFFCQGTNDRLNTATAILRGLIWMLVRQQKSLIRHLDEFKDLGSTLFEAHAAFYKLKKILLSMLGDEALERAYLVIDALDECRREEPGLPQLLELISEFSETQAKVKWLVSSRNEPEIEAVLEECTTRTRLSLELNAKSVAGAVEAYIKRKMSDLAETYRKLYAGRKGPKIQDELQEVRDGIAKEIRLKADGTFLWVALVFRQIKGCGADEALGIVRQIPSGLDDIYAQMICQITELDAKDSQRCKRVLLTMVNAYRPLHLSELVAHAELPELAVHEKIVRRCGLLTIKEDDDIVYFVHQSAKDYLIKGPSSDLLAKIFPNGYAEGHHTMVSRSLDTMSTTLQRDIYKLKHPGFSIEEIKSPDLDPLAPIRYACVYWVDHLCETESSHDGVGFYEEKIDKFWRKHFLHWLEALSLIRSISDGVFAIAKLAGSLKVSYYLNKVEYLLILIDPESLIRVPTSQFGSGCSSIYFVQ
jgi:N-terminal domain of NWD NACHT-NTPase/NACHT domain